MTSNAENQPLGWARQVIVAADERGVNILLDSMILHRADVAAAEEPIIDGCVPGGDTHPAVDRAIRWAQENSYAVAMVIW